jgi:hypothetical protein
MPVVTKTQVIGLCSENSLATFLKSQKQQQQQQQQHFLQQVLKAHVKLSFKDRAKFNTKTIKWSFTLLKHYGFGHFFQV